MITINKSSLNVPTKLLALNSTSAFFLSTLGNLFNPMLSWLVLCTTIGLCNIFTKFLATTTSINAMLPLLVSFKIMELLTELFYTIFWLKDLLGVVG